MHIYVATMNSIFLAALHDAPRKINSHVYKYNSYLSVVNHYNNRFINHRRPHKPQL